MGNFSIYTAMVVCVAITVYSTVSLDKACDHYDENLYCFSHNPNTFYRCVDGRLFTFKCLSNLKFNMNSRICQSVEKCLPSEYNQEMVDVRNWRHSALIPSGIYDIDRQLTDKPLYEKSYLPSCDPDTCLLPHCHCPSTYIPGGLKPDDTPQMVMITFDDKLTGQYYKIFQRLFRHGRNNPNGCPIKGGLFISGNDTDYQYVYPLYQSGHEINIHTISHRYPIKWWSNASYEDYIIEVMGLTKVFQSLGIPKETIKGFRVPFLEVGGDSQYQVLSDYGFMYDSSLFTNNSLYKDHTPIWPYTLDHVLNNFLCNMGKCPKKTYPGMWEISLQTWIGVDEEECNMADACSTGEGEETIQFLRDNFSRYYYTNRAPLGIHIHFKWVTSTNNFNALDKFIDELLAIDDVWIVTPFQVIDWMLNPTSANQLRSSKFWPCYEA